MPVARLAGSWSHERGRDLKRFDHGQAPGWRLGWRVTAGGGAILNAYRAPENLEIYREVARRAVVLLDEQGAELRSIGLAALERDDHVLAFTPTTLWPLAVVRSCVAAGGDWKRAVWPAVAVECAMAAADLFDEIADGDASELVDRFGLGALVTAAAGLLALGGEAVLRATEDGVEEVITLKLGRTLGKQLAHAADGQTVSLRGIGDTDEPELAAYRLAALKSGPLGALAFGLGSIAAGCDDATLAHYQSCGWHLAVASQLLNDAIDVFPDRPSGKADVRDGVPTVPLVFAGSRGAPTGLVAGELAEWETTEKRRVASMGGIILAELLAKADRLRAEEAIERLAVSGHDVAGLRSFLTGPNRSP